MAESWSYILLHKTVSMMNDYENIVILPKINGFLKSIKGDKLLNRYLSPCRIFWLVWFNNWIHVSNAFLPHAFLIFAVIVAFLNSAYVRYVTRVQTALAVTKFLALVLITALGFWKISTGKLILYKTCIAILSIEASYLKRQTFGMIV